MLAPAPTRPVRRALVRVTAALLALLLGGCAAADDGIRVRDRDGAGVLFEDQS